MPDEELKFYDVSTDEFRRPTQADIDSMARALQAFDNASMAWREIPEPLHGKLTFKLALFPNRMRPGEAWVAEDIPIEPYPGEVAYGRKPLFPSTPKTHWLVPTSFSAEFAAEIVRRWNGFKEPT